MNTAPTPTGTEALVCQDIAARQQLGIAKYGTTVANNPLKLRGWLEHAYQECLDQAIYLKRAIQELDRTTCATAPESDLWIAHIPGHPMPCEPDTKVHYKTRCGHQGEYGIAADRIWWDVAADGVSDFEVVAWKPA